MSIGSSFQALIREISYQRNRELRSEESGFVHISPVTFWTGLFVDYFVNSKDLQHDDLLFLVRKQAKKGSKMMAKMETIVDVHRKDSRRLPIGAEDVDWEETVYLNLIMQQFEYHLTVAVCTRTSPNELQILSRQSRRVFASPSGRSMHRKGEGESMTYPDIFFGVDDFDRLIDDVDVRDGQMLVVELAANDRLGDCRAVVFLGSVQYDTLRMVYESKSGGSSSRFRSSKSAADNKQRFEFIRMRGPNARGLAELAVTRIKGSSTGSTAKFYIESPTTSEPGLSLTDFDWDERNDCDDPLAEEAMENGDPFNQRRMSDPSSDLKTRVLSWRQKMLATGSGNNPNPNPGPNSGLARTRARSENERLDLVGVSEIEAGDVIDELDVTSDSFRFWCRPGFRQAYHIWKETRRLTSRPVQAHVTHITLPWTGIVADLLSNSRQESVLNF